MFTSISMTIKTKGKGQKTKEDRALMICPVGKSSEGPGSGEEDKSKKEKGKRKKEKGKSKKEKVRNDETILHNSDRIIDVSLNKCTGHGLG